MSAVEEDQRRALVAWSVLAEAGDAAAAWLVDTLGPVEALAWADAAIDNPVGATAALTGIAPMATIHKAIAIAPRWRARRDQADVDRVLERTHACRARVIARGDAGWPGALDDLGLRTPYAIWVRGGADLESCLRDGVAVVGSRSATAYGEYTAGEIAGSLAEGELQAGGGPRAIVSGGAYGIDAAAHRAALAAGGVTVAVLAGGIDRLYPVGHADLLEEVIETGAVVAESPPGHAPYRARFLERNRIIAAAATTVVVEAAIRSGALSTARHAAALQRPVGAVPGPVSSPASGGCHALIRDAEAVLVRNAWDVRELAGPLMVTADGEDSDPVGFAHPHDRAVYDAMGGRGGSLDTVARRAGVTPQEALASAGRLELEGLVVRRGGGWRRA